MKKYLILILIIVIVKPSFTQSINNLDKKRGYKQFTLGDSYTKWQDYIKYDTTENNVKQYKYIGDQNGLFNTYPVSVIYLKFSKLKLVDILIVLKAIQGSNDEETSLRNVLEKYVDIGDRFNLLYGNATKVFKTRNSIENNQSIVSKVVAWGAKKTSLLLLFKFIEFKNTGVIAVEIEDNSFIVSNSTEGF